MKNISFLFFLFLFLSSTLLSQNPDRSFRKRIKRDIFAFVRSDVKVFSKKLRMVKKEIYSEYDRNLFRKALLYLYKKLHEKLRKDIESFDRYAFYLYNKLQEYRIYYQKAIFNKTKYSKQSLGYKSFKRKLNRIEGQIKTIWNSSIDIENNKRFSYKLWRKKIVFLEQYFEKNDIAYQKRILPIIKKQIIMKKYLPNNSSKKLYTYNREIYFYNSRFYKKLNKYEYALVCFCNDYRNMMGVPSLKLSKELITASKKHSIDMAKFDLFNHVLFGRRPIDRARLEGYKGLVGENIFMGRFEANEAFASWLKSPGHHRNILSKRWKSFGVGSVRKFWTVKFGSK